jgi:hypothetical protein
LADPIVWPSAANVTDPVTALTLPFDELTPADMVTPSPTLIVDFESETVVEVAEGAAAPPVDPVPVPGCV